MYVLSRIRRCVVRCDICLSTDAPISFHVIVKAAQTSTPSVRDQRSRLSQPLSHGRGRGVSAQIPGEHLITSREREHDGLKRLFGLVALLTVLISSNGFASPTVLRWAPGTARLPDSVVRSKLTGSWGPQASLAVNASISLRGPQVQMPPTSSLVCAVIKVSRKGSKQRTRRNASRSSRQWPSKQSRNRHRPR
jgi:hypothetical protein